MRLLLRSPGYAGMAILTLALGIGANSAVFTVLNAIVLKPLPFPEPDRIVRIRGHNELRGWTNGYVTMPDIDEIREQSAKLKAVSGWADGTWILSGRGVPPSGIKGAQIRWDFFSALGVRPRLGRAPNDSEFASGAMPAAVLSDHAWRTVFQADPAILNTTVIFDSEPHLVVGIMPPDFQFPSDCDLWVSTPGDRAIAVGRAYATTNAIARLAPGTTIEAAGAEVSAIASRLSAAYPNSHHGFTTDLVTLAQDQAGDARAVLQLFLAAVACVLLIACSNVANLMLARATGRSRELAIRAALGATSGRLLAQTFAESLILSLAGAAVGLVIAQAALRALVIANAHLLPRATELRLEPLAVVYTLLVALLTSLLFGAFPAFAILRADVQRSLNNRSGTVSMASSRARTGLVISQFALATILACSAGLLVKTFYKLIKTDPGFQMGQILMGDVTLPEMTYKNNITAGSRFFRDAVVALSGLPGVQEAGAVTNPPLGSGEFHRQLGVFGGPANQKIPVTLAGASVGYHKAMGIPLLQGRYFRWGDLGMRDRDPVILSESVAKRLFGGSDAVGREVGFSSAGKFEVVGVVGDIRSASLDQPPQAHIYVPLERSMMLFATFAIRSQMPADRLAEVVRAELARVGPDIPLLNVRTMEEVADRNLAGARLRTTLFSAFAGGALVLAVVGIYGLLSYTVEQRSREMGVRVALGASSLDVAKLIVGQGIRLALVGVAIGLGIAFGVGRAMGGLIYGIEPLDPEVAVISTALFLMVSVAASLGPAIRAAQANPLEVLRQN